MATSPKSPPLHRRLLFGIALVALLFVGTYALAWYRAYTLTLTFMHDADTSYAEGRYLDALTGYDEFDRTTNAYIVRGGYMNVTHIWATSSAWPRPDNVAQAETHIDTILATDLTIDDALSFIQANIGKQNPSMGRIYLRLGELYEQAGADNDATEVYRQIAELFPDQPGLNARAQEHLTRFKQVK